MFILSLVSSVDCELELIRFQHSECAPSTEAASYSLQTAVDWFEMQYRLSNGAGAPKNINTMSPFYMLSTGLLDGKIKDEDGRWKGWCSEWAEWVMNDLPRE